MLDFARKYDPQPFHLSDEAAAKTHFGRLAASGWHTCAMTMAVIVASRSRSGRRRASARPGVDELRWLKPVYPGDTLTVRGKIVEKTPSRSKPEIGSFRTETTVTNQDDVPVMRFTSIVLIRRRPAEAKPQPATPASPFAASFLAWFSGSSTPVARTCRFAVAQTF